MDQSETQPQDDSRPDWLQASKDHESGDEATGGAFTIDDGDNDKIGSMGSSIGGVGGSNKKARPSLLQRAQYISGLLSLLLSPVSIAFVSLWVQNEAMGGGGVSWSRGDAKRVFNWHPILMVTAFALMNVGALIFRASGTSSYQSSISSSKSLGSSASSAMTPVDAIIPQKERKRAVMKLLHGSIWTLTFIFGLVGILAVFKSHNDPISGYIANLYSLHSWIGIFVSSLFTLQFLFGILAFGGFLSRRGGVGRMSGPSMMEIHKYTGAHIHLLVTATILLGIQEKEGFVQCSYKVDGADLVPILNISKIPSACLWSHGLGIVILAMGVFTGFALARFPVL